MMVGSTGCGYLLYPGRRGRTGGRVDVLVLIIDLLWLIPGLIPGLICLVVDFTTGCIYEGGERGSLDPAPNETRELFVEIEVDGAIVATGEVGADRKTHLRWKQGFNEAIAREKGRLIVRTADGSKAEANVRDLI